MSFYGGPQIDPAMMEALAQYLAEQDQRQRAGMQDPAQTFAQHQPAPFGRFGGEENGLQGYYAPRGHFIPTEAPATPEPFSGAPLAADQMQGMGESMADVAPAPKPKKGKNSEFFALLTKMKQEDKEGKKDTRKALSSLAKQLQSESATENPSNASGTVSV